MTPITTKLADTETPLRLRLAAETAGLDRDSDALVAQLIAVANESFRKELGTLPNGRPPTIALVNDPLMRAANSSGALKLLAYRCGYFVELVRAIRPEVRL